VFRLSFGVLIVSHILDKDELKFEGFIRKFVFYCLVFKA